MSARASESARADRGRASRYLNVLPMGTWILVFTVLPFAILFLYSFWQVSDFALIRNFTLKNYADVFLDKLFGKMLLKTLGIAVAVTAACLGFGYPVAYFIANRSGKLKNLLYILIIIPLWTSYIVRIFSWKALLGREGVLNNILIYLGLTDHPVSFLLYSTFSVFLALIGILLPYMILPIFTTLEKIPRNLFEASMDLGGSKFFTFARVVFPLSMPGVLAGCFFVFVLTLGDYITPRLLGGSGGILLGWVIYSKFGLAFQWPTGSAMSFLLLIIVLVILNFMNRGGALEEL
jgi:spermidine/putrescine transport system permease protein